MSTEHQQYSTDSQAGVILEYAVRRGFEVVRTYADEGRSGLRIAGRRALQELLSDIETGQSDFSAVLVYDVSRWGRFQDPDEAASIELRCKRAGVALHYCAEQFENDGSIGSSIIKTVKRAMAGEYSRELSAKVYLGQAKNVTLGYRSGGAAGYGLRRLLVDQFGKPKLELAFGERKSIATDRVVLVHGPAHEVETVRDIYQRFVNKAQSESQIAESLNARGIRTDFGRKWTTSTVRQILTNEKYIGNNVWSRSSGKLKTRRVLNVVNDWVRYNQAFDPLVGREMFDRAQDIIRHRSAYVTDESMLDSLRKLLSLRGKLSGEIIDNAKNTSSSDIYRKRFGSLVRAYNLIGFRPRQSLDYIRVNKTLTDLHPSTLALVERNLLAAGIPVIPELSGQLLWVNGEVKVAVLIARCLRSYAGSRRWMLRLDKLPQADIVVVVRMSSDNLSMVDYYIFPMLDIGRRIIRMKEFNDLSLEAYRVSDLECLRKIFSRAPIRRVA
jgi:DNA invertase Pin-like site-specific DNA recombinase